MITGVLGPTFMSEAEGVRASFPDVLGFASVDTGEIGAWIRLAGGGELSLYQPKHPSPPEG